MQYKEIDAYSTVFTSAICQTTTTCVKTARTVFLVDPNWLPEEIGTIRDHIESIRGKRKLYLIFTHADYDHIIGYGAFPGAKVIATHTFKNFPEKDRAVRECINFDKKRNIVRAYQHAFPDVDIAIRNDGKAMHFSGSVLTFYLAPGHTREGMYILFEPYGIWCTGDYLSDIEFPFIEDNIASYKRTLQKTDRILRHHQIQYMIPGHGSIAGSKEEILRRRDAAMEYIADLENAIQHDMPFPIKKYQTRYPDWEALCNEHQKNACRLRDEVD